MVLKTISPGCGVGVSLMLFFVFGVMCLVCGGVMLFDWGFLSNSQLLIVSTGYIQWILWLSIHYAAAHREIFSVNSLRGKLGS